MSSFSWPLTVNGSIWVMVLYVFVYCFLARAVFAEISRQIPRYFDGDEEGNLPTGMATSMAIMEMLLDGDLPGSDFGRFVRYGLCVA